MERGRERRRQVARERVGRGRRREKKRKERAKEREKEEGESVCEGQSVVRVCVSVHACIRLDHCSHADYDALRPPEILLCVSCAHGHARVHVCGKHTHTVEERQREQASKRKEKGTSSQ